MEHPERELHRRINLLLNRLDEQQRRWLAAVLAEHYGLSRGGIRLVSQITGLSEKTIRRGLNELRDGLADRPDQRIRKAGAGRRGRSAAG